MACYCIVLLCNLDSKLRSLISQWRLVQKKYLHHVTHRAPLYLLGNVAHYIIQYNNLLL